MVDVGHRVTLCPHPAAERSAKWTTPETLQKQSVGEGGKLTAVPSERVRELPRVLRLVKAERANNLYLDGDDTCVKHYTSKIDKTWSYRHALRLYETLTSNDALALMRART